MYFPGSLRASLAVLGLICFMHAQLLGLARANDPKSLESKLTKANYEKIKTGMTREQVEEILGPGKDMSASEYPQPRTRVQARIKQLLDSGVATALKWEAKSPPSPLLPAIIFTRAFRLQQLTKFGRDPWQAARVCLLLSLRMRRRTPSSFGPHRYIGTPAASADRWPVCGSAPGHGTSISRSEPNR